MTTTTRATIPAPRTPARPADVPAAVWNAVHTTSRLPDTGRDTDGWQRCGAYEIRFDDDRRER